VVRFKAANRLDRVFEVGILLKALDGLLEIAGGVLLLLIKPQYLTSAQSIPWCSSAVRRRTSGAPAPLAVTG
jgi:uncharacterized membrane protein